MSDSSRTRCADCNAELLKTHRVGEPCPKCGSSRRHLIGTLDAQIPLPTMESRGPTATAFIRTARNFFTTLQILSQAPTRPPADVTAFLAAHCLELSLKAFLLQVGKTEDDLKKRIGHDLVTAWKTAATEGLAIDASPPTWCRILSSSHTRPFLNRYARENTGLQVPALSTLLAGLGDMMGLVEKANRGSRRHRLTRFPRPEASE